MGGQKKKKKKGKLEELELMRPAGLKAFEAREENRSGIYSYEQRSPELPDQYRKILKNNSGAEKFFDAQPPSYLKAANWWVQSAKREETRLKRLNKLIQHSERGEKDSAVYPSEEIKVSTAEDSKARQDFINGFLAAGKINGRPVDILSFGVDGFLLTDDYAGVVYYVHEK